MARYVILGCGDFKLRWQARRVPLRIVIGAGGVCPKGWVPTDIEHLNLLSLPNWHRYFQEESITAILSEHVWEHLSPNDAIAAARNCYRFLKPKGYIRIAVPDGLHPSIDYIDDVKPMGKGAGADDHQVLYDYQTLSAVFESVGFSVELLEYHDENGFFHETEWRADDGMIHRSKRFDPRNKGGTLNYTSIILDAFKR